MKKARETREIKTASGLTYLSMGLLIFLGLAYDALQRIVDKFIYSDLVANPFFASPWYVLVTHWVFVIIVWSLSISFMLKWIRKQSEEKQISFKLEKSLVWLLPIAVMSGIIVAYLELLIEPVQLPQITREYLSFVKVHGSYGLIVSITQNIYYIAESAMIVLLLSLMQSAGECWFKSRKIPYCSLGLSLTWGIGHLTHGGITSFWISLIALLMGGFYLLSKKSIWATYLFVLLIFVI